MALLERIFGKKDWKTVEALKGEWQCTSIITGRDCIDTANYEIQFSPSRNSYRVKTSGLNPKGHSAYQKAIELMNKYESQL